MLKVYNTLTRKKEVFHPINESEVTVYSCGPTVYNFSHIGNCRSFIFADILRRYLKYKGYKVKHVRNLTDVDDKTIKGSMNEHVSLREFTEKYTKLFFEDMKTLNVENVEYNPKATEHIKEMVELIKKLLEKGYAYKTDDGIYFKISKFKNYGKLAHLDLEGLKSGATVKTDEYDKENVSDFALWKFWDEADGNVFWETEIGKGRPGWHIECSAMSTKYLGETIDLHTGGVDLIFPHHQNEIAQSEAANDKKFVNYWMHCEHLLVDGKKMSKSLGNFYTLRDVLAKGYSAKAVRYLLLSMSYRQQLNFTFEALEASDNAIKRLKDFILKLRSIKTDNENKNVESLIKKVEKQFEKAMDDDLNTSEALAAVFDFMKEINVLMMDNKIGTTNAGEILRVMNDFDGVLGVLDFEEEKIDIDIEKMIQQREEARKKRDFATADRIRDELKQKGIVLEDTPQGVRWKKG